MNHYKLELQESKFDFLSPEEMKELIKEYYEDRVPMNTLKIKYKLTQNSNFEHQFPWIETDEICALCSNPMVIVPHHRNFKPNKPICINCRHKNVDYCSCRSCQQVERDAYFDKIRKREEIISNQLLLEDSKKISFDKLTAEEKISLGILVRNMSSDDLSYIVPFQTAENWKNNKDFVLPLYKAKIITIHPESDYSYITVKENKFKETVLSVELHKMKWNINVSKEELSNYELYYYLAKAEDKLKLTTDEIFLYWKKIAKHEAQKYLVYNMESILGIKYEKDIAIDNLLENLTNHFSIGQVYNLIWKYTNSALRFKTERRATEDHIFNYLLKCIKDKAKEIIRNNWKLEHYGKPKYIQDSSFSDYFFDYILKANEQSNKITPSDIFERYGANEMIKEDGIEQFKTIGDYLKAFKFYSNDEPFENLD